MFGLGKSNSKLHIVIRSMGRWDTMTTHNIVSDAVICVPDSEKSQYKEFHPDSDIISHPDTVAGLSAKNQWMMDRFENAFILDDDLNQFVYLGIDKTEKTRKFTKDEVRDFIYMIYEAACDCGAKIFGFNNVADVRMYIPLRPIKFTGYIVGGAMGIRDWKRSSLYFDDRVKCVEDYWVCLLNAYFNRYVYKDCRFSFDGNTGDMGGGNSIYRNWEQEKKEFLFLRQMFGDAVQIKPESPFRKMTGTTNRHPFEKTIKIPF